MAEYFPPSNLRIITNSTHGQRETSVVDHAGCCRAAAAAAAAKQWLELSFDSALIYGEECIYDRRGEKRRAVVCFYSKKKKDQSFDAVDGEKIEGDPPHFVRRILRHADPLPSVPFLPSDFEPRIVVETDVDVVVVTESRDLEPAPTDALNDPEYIVFVLGVRSGRRLFWEDCDNLFVDAESGKLFHREDIPGESRSVIALMREGGPVLRCKTDYILFVWRRSGLTVEVPLAGGASGHVRSIGHPLDNVSWTSPWKSDNFDRNFREKVNT